MLSPHTASSPAWTPPPLMRLAPVPAPLHVLPLQLLHPQVTLQLCFLACALLRQPVTCYDIIGWALDAQLPFLRLPDIASGCLTGVQVLSRLLVFVSQTGSPAILFHRQGLSSAWAPASLLSHAPAEASQQSALGQSHAQPLTATPHALCLWHHCVPYQQCMADAACLPACLLACRGGVGRPCLTLLTGHCVHEPCGAAEQCLPPGSTPQPGASTHRGRRAAAAGDAGAGAASGELPYRCAQSKLCGHALIECCWLMLHTLTLRQRARGRPCGLNSHCKGVKLPVWLGLSEALGLTQTHSA